MISSARLGRRLRSFGADAEGYGCSSAQHSGKAEALCPDLSETYRRVADELELDAYDACRQKVPMAHAVRVKIALTAVAGLAWNFAARWSPRSPPSRCSVDWQYAG